MIDGYKKINPLELSKDEILSLVDEIIDRLNTQIGKS